MLRMKFCLLAVLGTIFSLSAAPLAAVAAEAPRLDWSAWEHLPAFDEGRVQPVDTFARRAVDAICDRQSPKLGLKGVIPDDELDSARYALARELFPAVRSMGLDALQPRTFQPSELLFSWLTEPQKWEDVPFILAEHDELREKYLDLPVTDAEGKHLRYASPRDIREASALHDGLKDLERRRRQARMSGDEFKPTRVETKLMELDEAYRLYRALTYDPSQPLSLADFGELGTGWRILAAQQKIGATWEKLADILQLFGPRFPEAGRHADKAQQAFQRLSDTMRRDDVPLRELEKPVIELEHAAHGLEDFFAVQWQKIRLDTSMSDDQHKSLRPQFRTFHKRSRDLLKQVHELQLALYDAGQALRVLPALNAYALEQDREREDEEQPWLSLQTVLHGSPEMLGGIPSSGVTRVRESFGKMREAYQGWRGSRADRQANEFAAATRSLARALRETGEAIEPLRDKLVLAKKDSDLIRYTAYPPDGMTDVEVRYNHMAPFQSSWIISLAALVALVLSFGVVKKPMFVLGVALLIVGLAWTALGFSLRMSVTRWAPVTNMFETVVYVPWFASLLGAWFTMYPLLRDGLKNAWRMEAIPRTWEATPLSPEQESLAEPGTWTLAGYLLMLPRALLMAGVFWLLAKAPYAAGGRTIVNVLPNIDKGQTLPDANDLMTWGVGMLILWPAVWILPRVLVAAVLSIGLVPLSLRGKLGQAMSKVYPRAPFALAAAFVSFACTFVAAWAPIPGKEISALQPVLRDNFWLTIHVLTIVSSYGAGLLAWGLGLLASGFYLFGGYRKPDIASPVSTRDTGLPEKSPAGDDADAVETELAADGRRPPAACATLAGYIYKVMQVAVLLLMAGTILGGLWADVSWGRFWGWDPKEVWALISGLVYLAILHGRYAGWFGNFGLAAGSVLGATAITFSWYGVNFVLGAGLHSYGFGSGGQAEALFFVSLNWMFLGAAAIRYLAETARSESEDSGRLTKMIVWGTVSLIGLAGMVEGVYLKWFAVADKITLS